MMGKPAYLFFQKYFYLILFLGLADISFAKDFDDSQAKRIEYPDWFIDSPFYDLAEEVGGLESKNKRGLMVLFTTEGCSYCSAFIERSLGNPEIAAKVKENFDSIGMEIFDDVGMVDPEGRSISIKDFAKREGAEYSPTLTFYNNKGKRVLRVVGYQSPDRFRKILDYVKGGHYHAKSLRDYFQSSASKETSAKAKYLLKEDSLFNNPPYALDRTRFKADKPLLVIFEKTNCVDCADFHTEVLALNEVRELLGKFETVRFDADDKKTPVLTPEGKQETPLSWFMNTTFSRVPALIFFDENGNKVLETDALVRRQRMMNSLYYVLERAYEKGWTYQRLARSKAIERNQKKSKKK